MCAIVVAAAGGPRLGLPACDDDVCGGNDDGTVVDGRWGCGWMGEYRPDPEIMGSRMRMPCDRLGVGSTCYPTRRTGRPCDVTLEG